MALLFISLLSLSAAWNCGNDGEHDIPIQVIGGDRRLRSAESNFELNSDYMEFDSVEDALLFKTVIVPSLELYIETTYGEIDTSSWPVCDGSFDLPTSELPDTDATIYFVTDESQEELFSGHFCQQNDEKQRGVGIISINTELDEETSFEEFYEQLLSTVDSMVSRK